MRGIHFIVPIGADQHQALHVRVCQEILHQVQRRRIEPLQIVEKQGQGMFRPREYIDKTTNYQLETSLGFALRKVRDRRLLSYNGLQFRDQTYHQLSVRMKRVTESIAPLAQLLFALTQEWANQALKGLRQSGIRDIALILVELACCKKASRRNQRLVQLIDDGGFADSGIAGNQNQLRPAAGYHMIKRSKQGLALALSPVQFLRAKQTFWKV